MNRLLRLFSIGWAAAVIPHAVADAQAGNYFLNSANPNNAVDVALLAGSWTIGVSNGAWSPFNYVSGCDVGGAHCHTGFQTNFYYMLNGGPDVNFGWDGNFSSPELALAHAFAPLVLDVTEPSTLKLFIPDCCYWDNVGGITITVAEVAAATNDATVAPEPATVVLMATGLAGLALAVRRRRP